MDEFMCGSSVHGDSVYLDDHHMDEKWAFIHGVPGYMISDKGRVWSERTQKFLKNKPMDTHGHLGVSMMHDGRRVYRYIHRLVAEAFIPNPNHLPIVRHLSDDPDYNDVEDLSWGTQRDNIHDAIANGKAYLFTNDDREKSCCQKRTPIKATNLSSGETFIYRGQNEASRILGIPQANIWKVLKGYRPQAKGYNFDYTQGGDIYER